MFDWINSYLGPLGVFASILGAYIAYITWINPLRRMKWFMLSRVSKWEKRVYEDLKEYEQWVFKPNPSFRIHIGKVMNADFAGEPWLPRIPKGSKNISFEVHLMANGVRLETVHFIGIDDLRLFIPLPKVGDEGYSYSNLQLQIHKIIGYFQSKVYGKDLDDFARLHKISIDK